MLRWNPPATVRRVAQAANPGFTRRQWALGGAWFFIGASIFGLGWIALNGGQGRVFGLESAGVDHTVWGLTYAGWLGKALLWTQIVAVIAAAGLTLLPIRRFRRMGHAALIGWASWWMLGTMYLASISPVGFGLQALLMTCLLGCTIARASMSRQSVQSPAGPALSDTSVKSSPGSRPHDSSDGAAACSASATLPQGWRERLSRASETTTNAIRHSAHVAWHRGIPAARKATVTAWQRLRQGFGGDSAANRATVDPRIRA